jgi:microcystin-dependent protein
MADAVTPYLGFTQPETGASRDTWGTKLNGNWGLIDQLLFIAMPVGALMDFAGGSAPPGWLICDGRLISRTTYSALFAVIGTAWGAGDGSTTFALPGASARALVGAGSTVDDNGTTISYSFAQKTGVQQRVIAQTNLPALALTSDTQGYHSHGGATMVGANHTHSMDVQGNHAHTTTVNGSHQHVTDAQGDHTHGIRLTTVGSGGWNLPNAGVQPVAGGSTDVAGNHQHNTDAQGNHQHTTDGQGSHQHNITYSGNLQLGIYADGNHQHNFNLGGSGTPLVLINPLLVCTKIIFAGQQAASLMARTQIEGTVASLLSAPLRGGMLTHDRRPISARAA